VKLAKLGQTIKTADLRSVKALEEKPWEHSGKARSSTAMGYNYKWQKARERHLQKEPLCRACAAEGRLNAFDLHVDHIVPHRGNQELFWSSSNWQTLCASHHSQKTARGE